MMEYGDGDADFHSISSSVVGGASDGGPSVQGRHSSSAKYGRDSRGISKVLFKATIRTY